MEKNRYTTAQLISSQFLTSAPSASLVFLQSLRRGDEKRGEEIRTGIKRGDKEGRERQEEETKLGARKGDNERRHEKIKEEEIRRRVEKQAERRGKKDRQKPKTSSSKLTL